MQCRWNNSDRKLFGQIRAAAAKLSERVDDMQASYDERSEKWIDSDRGVAVQDWLCDMEARLREIEDMVDELEEETPRED